MEDLKDKTVSVNIENYTGEKPIEVIIRKGEAAKAVEPLATKAPIKTNISGVTGWKSVYPWWIRSKPMYR